MLIRADGEIQSLLLCIVSHALLSNLTSAGIASGTADARLSIRGDRKLM